MKTNGTLSQLPDLRGGATHQFRKAGTRNAPWSAALEDSHRPQSLKRRRAFDENLFSISLTDLLEEWLKLSIYR